MKGALTEIQVGEMRSKFEGGEFSLPSRSVCRRFIRSFGHIPTAPRKAITYGTSSLRCVQRREMTWPWERLGERQSLCSRRSQGLLDGTSACRHTGRSHAGNTLRLSRRRLFLSFSNLIAIPEQVSTTFGTALVLRLSERILKLFGNLLPNMSGQ